MKSWVTHEMWNRKLNNEGEPRYLFECEFNILLVKDFFNFTVITTFHNYIAPLEELTYHLRIANGNCYTNNEHYDISNF